jgi:uncharacterized protein
MSSICVIGAFVLVPFLSYAQSGQEIWGGIDPMKIPALTEAVVDYAWVIEASALQSLRIQAKTFQTLTSNELAVVLFPHRQGNELIDIGLKVFRETGIGDAQKNNGLLLLIATDEKKIRIIVGYGLEWAFPDVAAREVIEKYIRPRVNAGDFPGAVKAFYDVVPKYIDGEFTPAVSASDARWKSVPLFDFLWSIGTAIFFVLTAARIKKWNYKTHTVYQDTPRGRQAVTTWWPNKRYLRYFLPGIFGWIALMGFQPWGITMIPRGLMIGAFLWLMTLGWLDNRRRWWGFFPSSWWWSSGGDFGWGWWDSFDFGGGDSGWGGAGD